uniref:Cytosol aminopeptidase n=1 Tax=Clastoptera arizonana TaxID=38151 RepID=A0A1B6BYN6_9HEMI
MALTVRKTFQLLQRTNVLMMKSFTTKSFDSGKKGLVLGAYNDGAKGETITFTEAAQEFDDNVCGMLTKHLQVSGLKKGKSRVFYNLTPEYEAIAVVGLGKREQGYNELEEIEESRESVRIAAAAGCRKLQDIDVREIYVEHLGDPEAAAEGAILGPWVYQENKMKEKQKQIPKIEPYKHNAEMKRNWDTGVLKAEAQNISRRLSDTPANQMTPTVFAKNAEELLKPLGVKVYAHDRAWAESKKMYSYLSVTNGSAEPPVFLEMCYNGGAESDPVVLVGKGITFDSGGISIKPSAEMDQMRADMSGAACVLATLYAVANLKLPINVVCLTPLCENMPGGRATKPGDVVTAMNGKTIKIDNTDAEGRLVLADALCYAATFKPKFTLDIATLTGAMMVAIGQSATGVFSNSTPLWELLHKAGEQTGDRVWRFPLWDHFSKRVADYPSVDVNNVGKGGRWGGACTAAAFLWEFAPKGDWLHMDMAGVMGPDNDMPYLQKGMTGRPTRTLIQFLTLIADRC